MVELRITTFYGSELGGTKSAEFSLASTSLLYIPDLFIGAMGPSTAAYQSKIGVALLFEAIYFLSLIPTI